MSSELFTLQFKLLRGKGNKRKEIKSREIKSKLKFAMRTSLPLISVCNATQCNETTSGTFAKQAANQKNALSSLLACLHCVSLKSELVSEQVSKPSEQTSVQG